ncbi:HlyD family secretion protein, partial [Acinetobacter baumannii]|nr:HlyD family secretion protein [Acinetobacter baumannii]
FSFTFLTICALCIALVIIAFAIWGSYTKRSTVQGQLTPQSGLVQGYTTQSGTILKKNVYEGQSVKTGDILFTISTESYGEQGSITDALAKQTQLKEQSIRNEISRIRFIHQDEKRTINNQISLLNGTLVKVENLIYNQLERINLAKRNQQRYEIMLKQDAASYEEFEARKINYLDQLAQYESLQREKVSLEKQLTEQQISLSGLENRQNNQ